MIYTLSKQAEDDLSEIFDFGVYQFGLLQAEKYVERLVDSIEAITINPRMGKSMPELYEKLRSLTVGSHCVYYEIQADSILIIRILHHSRDVDRYF